MHNRTEIVNWEWEHAMHSPTFDPDKATDDIVVAIKHIKKYFKSGLHTKSHNISTLKHDIDAILGHLGQTSTSH